MQLQTIILAQALTDVLRYRLGMPLLVTKSKDEIEEAYETALCRVLQFPKLIKRLSKRRHYRRWLFLLEEELECHTQFQSKSKEQIHTLFT